VVGIVLALEPGLGHGTLRCGLLGEALGVGLDFLASFARLNSVKKKIYTLLLKQ
jgi:hypothetical protein